MRIHFYIFLFLSFIFSFSFSQDTLDNSTEQKIENIAENLNTEEADYTQLLEQLVYFKEHPINLNSAKKEELEQLQLLDEIQINNLLNHIEKNGNLITIYELQTIDGFDTETIQKILSYVKVTDTFTSAHFTLGEMWRNGKHNVTLRYAQVLEEQKGFTPVDSGASANSRYLGTPQKLYARYRFTYGTNVSFGITAEKDAGEEFFRGSQKEGFDFYSAHWFLKGIRFARAAVVGDYTVGFGQGLVMWSGLAYGKSADAVNIKKNALGIRPYTSVDENLFLRGGAVTLGWKGIELTPFYSYHRVDANVSDTLADGEIQAVSSLQETGYHTIPSEIADKHSLGETVFGGNLSCKTRKFKIGMTGAQTQLTSPLRRSLELYNQFEFSSKYLTNASVDYNFIVKNFNFFGEAAASVSDGSDSTIGYAYLNGFIAALDPKVSISVLHRDFKRNYQSLFANAFAESTKPANEQGLYAGITLKPLNVISINAYYDRFVFPWLKYQVNAPSFGSEYFAQINYTPSKKTDMYFRVRMKDKFKNHNIEDRIDYIVPVQQINYRFHIGYQINKSITLKNRVEIIQYKNEDGETENGYLVYQDIAYKKLGSKISLTARYALFDTKTYDSRLYSYENDIPGTFSIPSFYYKGSRAYLMVNYDITRSIECWVRVSQTFYSNKTIISEGSLTEISGSAKTELKAQLRLKF